MLEYFSKNTAITLGAVGVESIVPFSNQHLLKGCGTAMSGNSLQINKCGIYDIDCDLSFSADIASTLTFTLYVDGVAQPQTVSSETITAADNSRSVHLSTYVTKQDNNCRCNPCTAPTNIYLTVSSSVADTVVTFDTTNIKAYKVA